MALQYLLTALCAYLVGAVPFGFLIGRCYGVDIRKVGSGNIGATNVTRSIGKWQGKLCFLLDLLKGALPVAVVQLTYPDLPSLALLAGTATIAGHIFPIYLNFKGGKGISTAAGVALALAPIPLLAAFAIWVVTFLTSRYVSLASIVAAAMLPILTAIFMVTGVGTATAKSPIVLVFFIIIAILAIYRHKSNIARLRNGTESRFEKKKANKENA